MGVVGEPEDDQPADVPGPRTLESLYREAFVPSLRLARLLTGDRWVAEELVQDAFVRMAPRVGIVDVPEAYLRTIVVNLCRDHARRSRVRRDHVPAALAAPESPIPGDEAVWRVVQGLPDRMREAVVLRYWADLPFDEIARLVGVRPATARSLVRRGLERLKEVVTDDR